MFICVYVGETHTVNKSVSVTEREGNEQNEK